MKYPFVYILRHEKYNEIDNFITKNKDKLNCTIQIIGTKESNLLNNMFDSNHHILITYGEKVDEYLHIVKKELSDRMCHRWIHKVKIDNIKEFNNNVNYCYINNAIMQRTKTRPIFSIFTSCYNSYDKINRAYEGLKSQTLKDWEWILLDDSPDDDHFIFLRKVAEKDKRIRLYKRDRNSGNIGNVKNETIGLCRGKYILELDHDDIILPDVLKDATDAFEENPDVGFIYMDFINIYENWESFVYGGTLCKGYAAYYLQKYNNKWVHVYITPNVNNVTLSHLACCPNHPRIWRRDLMFQLENYSEFLPICDDFEILLKTAINTKIIKIHKFGYIQFMNANNNNFSLIRNHEINRLGPQHIRPQFFKMYKINEEMKKTNSHEDEKYIFHHSNIWKRPKPYVHKHYNKIINKDYDKQYCLIGIKNLDNTNIKEIYKNTRNDIFLLDNEHSIQYIIGELEKRSLTRIKFASLKDNSIEELKNFFHFLCKHNENYEIIENFAEKTDKPEKTDELSSGFRFDIKI
ncbi:MAG: hypothetical protein CL678_06125 [Bdellovibrionaceae bacterium]|nr:hypothetical protein [Pseudobdellovibrionaceae bacterium]|tara:strand:+ start:93 stop:1652 length:1560 start_codon:yes stop_codon:yes gene_type:complete